MNIEKSAAQSKIQLNNANDYDINNGQDPNANELEQRGHFNSSAQDECLPDSDQKEIIMKSEHDNCSLRSTNISLNKCLGNVIRQI